MNNISKIKNCYGCGVCSASCPKDIIKIKLNKYGFYEPQIKNEDLCINCGICVDVCAFSHKKIQNDLNYIKSWAAWNLNDEMLLKSSSGGINYQIAELLISNGYIGIGCKYNEKKQRAEHFVADNIDEYKKSIGSKYIQSFTVDALKRINKKKKYFIVGTPCQVDSLRRMVKRFKCEENFVLIDFFCHSVPSYLVWRAYCERIKKYIGNINFVSWRNKRNISNLDFDWHNSYCMKCEGEMGCFQSNWSDGDLFFKFYFSDICSNKACSKNCKYKYNRSSADIRIGDLWGSNYNKNNKGVSSVIAFTQKGRSIIESLTNVSLIERPIEEVAEGQMKKNIEYKELMPVFLFLLRKNFSIDSYVFKILFLIQSFVSRIKCLL